IHADNVFSLYKDRRCEMKDILIEMDRILRPEGNAIVRLRLLGFAKPRLSWLHNLHMLLPLPDCGKQAPALDHHQHPSHERDARAERYRQPPGSRLPVFFLLPRPSILWPRLPVARSLSLFSNCTLSSRLAFSSSDRAS
ncbi:hypothetical protein SELMODRAFT_85154, partial [Selaginella moellendorffii]